MTIPVTRKRVKRPKTKTGCRTCRERHVKCDEAGFPCHRCVKAGRVCSGYDLPAASRSKTGYSNALLPRISCFPLARPFGTAIPSGQPLLLGSAENYALEIFRYEALQQLPGSSLNWERLNLQATYEEPAVVHVSMAIGFLYSSQIQRGKREIGAGQYAHLERDRQQLAFYHYSKAMRQIGAYIEAFNRQEAYASIEIILLVCLLFFCFEVLSGEDLQAIVHFRTGLRILYERSRHLGRIQDHEDGKRRIVLRPKPRDTMDLLINTFARLDSDVTLGDDYEPYLCPVVVECIPGYFGCLDEARIHLGALYSTIFDIFHDLDELGEKVVSTSRDTSNLSREELFCLASVTSRLLPSSSHMDLMERMEKAKEDLSRWSDAFTLLPHEPNNTSTTRLMTQIEYFELLLVTCVWKDESEMMIDRFGDHFAHLLHLAEQYVELHQENQTTRPAFPLGTSLVPCLAEIAWKCRAPMLRRKCIALIRKVNLRGVFDSEYLAAVSEKVVELEETRARALRGIGAHEPLSTEDIPEEARVLELEMCQCGNQADFWKLDTGRFVYVTIGTDGNNDLQLHEASITIPRRRSMRPDGRLGES